MASYALLVRESSNRVFGAAAPELAAAELSSVRNHLSCSVGAIDVVELEGLPYVRFEGDQLNAVDQFILSNLALARGCFEVVDEDLLRPQARSVLEFFDSDLITIQRYPGKTNEQFTHLLVNATVAASATAHQRARAGTQVRLLDPVAGRGSTLNRGLVYGFDVAGIEIDQSNVEHYKGFLGTYLKDHRLKHKIATERIRKGDLAGSTAFEVRLGRESKGQSSKGTAQVRMVRAGTEQASAIFSKASFDVVVGDLPYGIQHRPKGNKNQPTDSVESLVANSMLGWTAVLAPGGALGLSWNVKSMPRSALSDIAADHGLTEIAHERSFEHVVDRQITRDVLVCSSAGSSDVEALEPSDAQSR